MTSEPQIPAAFAGVVAGVTNLTSLNKAKPAATLMGQAIYNPKTHNAPPQWTCPDGFSATTPLYIEPGSPWENDYCESFFV